MQIALKPRHHKAAQYDIYLFYPTGEGKNGIGSWEKAETTTCRTEALNNAQSLHSSDKYEKIEIRKKVFCARRGRNRDMAVKILKKTRCPFKKIIAEIFG